MQITVDFLLIFFQNLVFTHLLGLNAVSFSDKKDKGLLRLGLLTILFCTVGSGVTAWVRPWIPVMYQKLLYPLIAAVISGLLDLLLVLISYRSAILNKLLLPQLHNAAFSGTVLGTVLLSTDYTHALPVAIRFGFQSGLGFFAACLMLHLAAPVCYSRQMPRCIRGTRGLLLYAGLLCMAAANLFPA